MNCFHVYSNKSCPIPSLSMLGWIASEKKKQSTRCLYSALICSKISCLDMVNICKKLIFWVILCMWQPFLSFFWGFCKVIDWIPFAQFYRCMLKDFSIMLFLYFGGKAVLALGLGIFESFGPWTRCTELCSWYHCCSLLELVCYSTSLICLVMVQMDLYFM